MSRTAVALLAMMAALSAAPAIAAGRKVIIDQDAFGPGGSNLQAIAMLLQDPDVELLGITVVTGDGWRDEEVEHVLRLLEIAGRPEVPVVPGAVFPLLNSPARTRAWERQFGNLTYKGAFTDEWPSQGVTRRQPHPDDPFLIPRSPAGTPRLKAATQNVASFLVDTVRRYPGEVSIIAAGPLTNIALAARLDPGFAASVRDITVMGGSLNPVAADNPFAVEYATAPRREFNFRMDPEATSLVFHEAWPRITLVPVDPTTRTLFRKELFERIGRASTPLASYLVKYGEAYPMWDEMAVAVWLDPSLIRHDAKLRIDVDTGPGASYGNTLSWTAAEAPGLGEREVRVVLEADVPKLESLTVALLGASPPRTR